MLLLMFGFAFFFLSSFFFSHTHTYFCAFTHSLAFAVMSTFSSNRFDALLGGEEGETDKLGNTKPLKKSEEPPRTRREAMNRKPHTRVAGKDVCSV